MPAGLAWTKTLAGRYEEPDCVFGRASRRQLEARTTEQAVQLDAVLGDPGKRVQRIKGWRCAAVQCDAMRCLFGRFEGRGSITQPLAVVAVVGEGQTDRQKDKRK